MVDAALLDIAGRVQRVVVGCEVEIHRHRDIQAPGAVIAEIGPQQAGAAPVVQRELQPGSVKHRQTRYIDGGAAGRAQPLLDIQFQSVRVDAPVVLARGAVTEVAVVNVDQAVGIAFQQVGSALQVIRVDDEFTVLQGGLAGLGEYLRALPLQQHARLAQGDVAGQHRLAGFPVDDGLIALEAAVALGNPDATGKPDLVALQLGAVGPGLDLGVIGVL